MTLTWCLTPGGDSQVTCGTQSSSGPRLIIKRNHWVVWDTVFHGDLALFKNLCLSSAPSSHSFLIFSLHLRALATSTLSCILIRAKNIWETAYKWNTKAPLGSMAHVWSYWQGISITRPKRYTYRHSSVLEHDQISENSLYEWGQEWRRCTIH